MRISDWSSDVCSSNLAVHGGDHHHEADGADGEATPEAAEPDVEHAIEVGGDAGLRQHVAHVDEQRQRQQRIPLHQLHGRSESEFGAAGAPERSEEHTSELQSLMRSSYDVFCLKKTKTKTTEQQ